MSVRSLNGVVVSHDRLHQGKEDQSGCALGEEDQRSCALGEGAHHHYVSESIHELLKV